MGKVFEAEVDAAVAETTDEEYPYDFTFAKRVIHFRKPSPGEAMVLSAGMGKYIQQREQLASIIDMFVKVLDPSDKDFILDHVYGGTLGPKTLFGENGDDGILADMVEQWSARPTLPSAPSSPSQTVDGSGSTPPILE